MRVFKAKDKKLRLEIAKQAGFTIDEAMLAYEFVNGNDTALSELKEFSQWNKYSEKQKVESAL